MVIGGGGGGTTSLGGKRGIGTGAYAGSYGTAGTLGQGGNGGTYGSGGGGGYYGGGGAANRDWVLGAGGGILFDYNRFPVFNETMYMYIFM